ncbi:MAG: replication-relaxation family protein [Acidimicrobiales bacterium]
MTSFSGSPGGPVRRRSLDHLSVLRSLTERDRFVVNLLGEHQVLTTGQVTQLAFPRLDVAQRRLLRLVRLGVLDRFRPYAAVGSRPWHYTVGPVGASLAAAQRGADPPSPAALRRRTTRLAESPRLAHLVGCNGWFCALAAYARAGEGRQVAAWWSERRTAARFGALVRPDAYGAWVEGGRRVGFFVEYDTGTEVVGRVAAKLDGYAELAAAGGPRVPVLMWLASATREAHLQRALASRPGPPTVATATAELASATRACPADSLWLVPGAGRRLQLVDLPSGTEHPRPADDGLLWDEE